MSLIIVVSLSPLIAAAASGTITITSPPANSFFAGPQTYTIRGMVSPVPQGPDNIFISVQESGVAYPVDVQTVALQANGSFSYPTFMGGNPAWTNGTYIV
ncbi:MAG: hypothetical protein OK456_08085, partial [Thaumarchaeota archaeon]|nr:hypothetical protein [Nitrososphaerota archaeon]